MLTGKNLIGYTISGEGSSIFPSSILVDETPTSHPFYESSEEEITMAANLAHKAFTSYRHLSPEKKASFLEKIAEGIASSKEELVKMAMHETNLPRPRLEGEVQRTINQLKLFAQLLKEGSWVKAIIDTGGQVTLGNLALRLALAERRGNGVQEGKLDQVFGSTLDMQVGTRLATPALALGTLLVRSPAMTFADFEIFKYWKMTEEPAMLIGMDVLGLLDTLIIDYRREELQVNLSRM